MDALCRELAEEHLDLDTLVSDLSESEWRRPTPAAGWTVADSVSHLAFFDQRAMMALTDPQSFLEDADRLRQRGLTDASVEPGRALSGAALLELWRTARAEFLAHAAGVDPAERVPWYGPAMGARSFVTARLMETWAHGQDVVDALGADRPGTTRLRHIAHIGIRARAFSYANRNMSEPASVVSVRLAAPDGTTWAWEGNQAADPDTSLRSDSIVGSALDFCRLVTQRRHLSDTTLDVRGPAAIEWMSIAQAFAGPPGPGRAPLR